MKRGDNFDAVGWMEVPQRLLLYQITSTLSTKSKLYLKI